MWGRRRGAAPVIPPQVSRRVAALASADLSDWADQAVYTAGRYLTLYRRSGDPKDLDEAATGAQVLLAIVEEIKQRN